MTTLRIGHNLQVIVASTSRMDQLPYILRNIGLRKHRVFAMTVLHRRTFDRLLPKSNSCKRLVSLTSQGFVGLVRTSRLNMEIVRWQYISKPPPLSNWRNYVLRIL